MVEYRQLAIDPNYRLGTDGSTWVGNAWGEWYEIEGSINKDGYRCIKVGGKRRTVHSLMLETFVGPRPPKLQGRHLNDVKTDNRLQNLAWGTNRQNHEDAVANGLVKPMLGDEIAREVVRLQGAGVAQCQIAEQVGTTPMTVSRILAGKLYAEATGIPPRKKNDFEGPRRATRIALLHSWDFTPAEICDFLDATWCEVEGVITGKSYSRVTGIQKQPPAGRSVQSRRIDSIEPDIRRLHGEGWSALKIAAHLGCSQGSVLNVVKNRRSLVAREGLLGPCPRSL